MQVTLLLPFVLGIFLLALQWAMYSWAETTAQAAAQDGARAAAAFNGTAAHGRSVAFAAADNGSLDTIRADVRRGPRVSSATVTGRALGVIPLFPVTVSVTADTPTERLTQP
ncbi:TadE-like protein [Tessaracoccus oleiagri]|uniref:TadE-like protein n=1 Tax=Tessaracoccus oleiagri TaxID=686624 RepID=A0A1G9N2Z9_9ACTN|nr:TadE-like protein [Tessaracoccus oleiagri]